MDASRLLQERRSFARLAAPAPEGVVRERIFSAALRAPDHARLRPWRFLVVEGEGRTALGEAMVRAMAAEKPQLDDAVAQKLRANPLRAPLVIVLVARVTAHPKVPEIEQQLSLGCAAQAMLLAAQAEGFGGIWRTGPVTYVPALARELGLGADDQVLGFLYLGTPASGEPAPERPGIAEHFSTWPS